jgi:hypothetical protein
LGKKSLNPLIQYPTPARGNVDPHQAWHRLQRSMEVIHKILILKCFLLHFGCVAA